MSLQASFLAHFPVSSLGFPPGISSPLSTLHSPLSSFSSPAGYGWEGRTHRIFPYGRLTAAMDPSYIAIGREKSLRRPVAVGSASQASYVATNVRHLTLACLCFTSDSAESELVLIFIAQRSTSEFISCGE